ncbi:MAG: NTP transferase domain-containing protein [Gemmatimonadota bacterium]
MNEPGAAACVVLAAGRSSRMEEVFKPLLLHEGVPLVGCVVAAARRAGLGPVIVVAGHRAAELRTALSGFPARVVENRDYASGVASSLAAGIAAAAEEPGVEAVAVLLGDEPGIRAEAISAAVRVWRETGAEAVRTVYADRPGHPVLFARAAFPALETLSGDRGARAVLDLGCLDVKESRLPFSAPIDVDTADDYRAMAAGEPGTAPSPGTGDDGAGREG